jgi:hypothetical protein
MFKKLKIEALDLLDKSKKLKDRVEVGEITINFPGFSVPISINNKQKNIAREIIIFVRDKRVLSSTECCTNCINYSLISLMNIRTFLVEKQMNIKNVDTALFLLIDFALSGIRGFMTYTEGIENIDQNRETYFYALNIIRGHLLRVFDEIIKIAEIPDKFGCRLDFVATWQKDLYVLNYSNNDSCDTGK